MGFSKIAVKLDDTDTHCFVLAEHITRISSIHDNRLGLQPLYHFGKSFFKIGSVGQLFYAAVRADYDKFILVIPKAQCRLLTLFFVVCIAEKFQYNHYR